MLSSKVREKSVDKKTTMRLLSILLVPVIALILGAAAPQVWAQEFDEAEIFFEFNSTDLDLGLHIFFDAPAWKWVEVRGPNGEIFEVENDGSLNKIGSTEVFTESAEPPLCDEEEESCDVDEAIQKFQNKFPAGTYYFRGRTILGESLSGKARLFHRLPAAPEIEAPDDITADPFNIKWEQPSDGPAVVSYEVVAEMVINGETFVNTATLPGSAINFTVSPEFMQFALSAGDALEEFKVEVVARAKNLNKTISEVVVFPMAEEQ